MPSLTFALDEDVAHSVASLLRSQGLNADSAKELGRLGMSDVQVLDLAAKGGQTLVTHNRNDFRMLHEAWVSWRRRWSNEIAQSIRQPVDLSHHSGILIASHLPNYDLASILVEFEETASSMADRLFVWNSARRWNEVRFQERDLS